MKRRLADSMPSLLVIIAVATAASNAFTFDPSADKIIPTSVIDHGSNITEEMVKGISQAIVETSQKCKGSDRSCNSQVLGIKVESLYGKSWNVHAVGGDATQIVGAQHSKDRWVSVVQAGTPVYTYYLFKPIDCSKPFFLHPRRMSNIL